MAFACSAWSHSGHAGIPHRKSRLVTPERELQYRAKSLVAAFGPHNRQYREPQAYLTENLCPLWHVTSPPRREQARTRCAFLGRPSSIIASACLICSWSALSAQGESEKEPLSSRKIREGTRYGLVRFRLGASQPFSKRLARCERLSFVACCSQKLVTTSS